MNIIQQLERVLVLERYYWFERLKKVILSLLRNSNLNFRYSIVD